MARVRPITILAKAAAYRARYSTRTVVSVAKATAVAAAAMAKAAGNASNMTEAVRKALERPSNLVQASPAECLAIGPRTAK